MTQEQLDVLNTPPEQRWNNPEWLRDRSNRRRLPQPLTPAELKKLADESVTKSASSSPTTMSSENASAPLRNRLPILSA